MKLVLIQILLKSTYPEYHRAHEEEPHLPPFARVPGPQRPGRSGRRCW